MEHLLNTAVLIIRVTHYKKLTSTQLVRTKLPLDLGPLLTHRATGAADPRSVVARTKEAPKHGTHPASLASSTLYGNAQNSELEVHWQATVQAENLPTFAVGREPTGTLPTCLIRDFVSADRQL